MTELRRLFFIGKTAGAYRFLGIIAHFFLMTYNQTRSTLQVSLYTRLSGVRCARKTRA